MTGFQRPVSGFVLSLIVMASAGFGTSSVQAQTRTIWDGVYTEDQAQRGRERYVEICGYCHRDDLSGGGSEAGAPALLGGLFTSRWQDRPLVDLFVTIGTTMPRQEPDSLSPQVVIDIVSFLLQANDIPAGDSELPPELAPLDAVIFTDGPVR
jgi:mono/diheme cytochrome c family protein